MQLWVFQKPVIIQWRRKYFRKEGAEKIRRKAPTKFFIAPPLEIVQGGQISVWACVLAMVLDQIT